MVASMDAIADSFEDAERELAAWGEACRRNAEALGVPTISSFAHAAAEIRRQERERRGVRKKALRQKHREQRKAHEVVDAKEAAEVNGFVEHGLTAQGKQGQLGARPHLQLDSGSARVDAIVARAPNWMQKVLHRTYRFGQPDRKAADDLMMPVGEYAQRRRASVFYIAEQLAKR